MQKITFQNLPNTTTPINATNLNAIQTNAETAINDVAGDLTDYVNGTTAMGDIKATGLTINTPTNESVGGTIIASNRGEASIRYDNNDRTKTYVAGYGTAGNDGFGVYSFETSKNIFTIDKNSNGRMNGFVSVNLGGNLGNPMPWRILEIPRQFNGTLYITSENYGGVMQNCILQISNAYGNVTISALSKQTYSSQLFSSARLVHALGNVAYLELITERTLNQTNLQITMVHSQNEGEYQFLNEAGNIPSGWSSTTENLQI